MFNLWFTEFQNDENKLSDNIFLFGNYVPN